MPKEPTGEEWTEEDQTILDSEEDDDGDENDNEPKKLKFLYFPKQKCIYYPGNLLRLTITRNCSRNPPLNIKNGEYTCLIQLIKKGGKMM